MPFKTPDIPNLAGKVAIVTGGNSGIGEVSCKELAAKVFMASRSEERAKAAIDKIKQAHPSADIHLLLLDLSSLASTKAAAEKWTSENSRLDILMNNAGVGAMAFKTTVDGVEIQSGTNVVGHYLFSMMLLPTLVRTARLPEYQNSETSVRVVHLSSELHKYAPEDMSFASLDKINQDRGTGVKSEIARYGISKAGNILLSNEIRKLVPSDVKISNISLHPGVVSTGIMTGSDQAPRGIFYRAFAYMASLVTTSPAQGALTQLYAATSPEVDSKKLDGAYLEPTAKLAKATKLCQDEQGVLGGELMSFCRQFVKEKVNVDVQAILTDADIQIPKSHL